MNIDFFQLFSIPERVSVTFFSALKKSVVKPQKEYFVLSINLPINCRRHFISESL